jgi:predicted ATPase
MGNHRSFRDEQELLLMPVYDKARLVLPVAAIYGANASGKSNLLDGLQFMATAVTDSFQRWDADGGVPRQFFRLDPAQAEQPSVFVVGLTIDDVPYTYGFAVENDLVAEEWLYSYPVKKKRVLFERERQDIKFGSTVADLKNKLELLEEINRPNSLFLSVAAQSNIEPFAPVSRWFRSNLRFRRPGRRRSSELMAQRLHNYLTSNPADNPRLVALLAAADVGIIGLAVYALDAFAFREVMFTSDLPFEQLNEHHVSTLTMLERERRPRVLLTHKGDEDVLFDLDDESDGTRSWLDLLPDVLTVLREGNILLVDEIDASLHPLLTAQLVGLFRNDESNPNGAQLIFTTHDASLLGTMLGEEVLARDQIWFVEKGAKGASKLYSLSDFKPRADGENHERRYLGGSYGGVPVLSDWDFVDAVRDL